MSPNPAKERSQLRVALRTKRAALSPAAHREMSRAAQQQLIAHPCFRAAKTVALYRAYGGETETAYIADVAISLGKVVVYAAAHAGQPLSFVNASSWTRTSFGLPVPVGMATELSAGDLIVVPGLAFDREGYRLGQGGGHYDRTLAMSPATPVGLAFECQLVDRCPRAAWDRPVRALATESTLYELSVWEN